MAFAVLCTVIVVSCGFLLGALSLLLLFSGDLIEPLATVSLVLITVLSLVAGILSPLAFAHASAALSARPPAAAPLPAAAPPPGAVPPPAAVPAPAAEPRI